MPTLTNKQLHQLLKPVIPFASKDNYFPIFNAVRIEPMDGKISAQATDRYRVGRVRLNDVDAGGFRATIPLNTAKWLLTVFKATHTNEVSLTLNGPDSDTTPPAVTVAGATIWGPNVELSLDQAIQGSGIPYPNLAKLFSDADERPVTGSATFNGRYLADIGEVPVNAVSGVPYVHVRLDAVGQRKGALFTHESGNVEFTGLVMPVNFPEGKDDI